MISRPKVGMQVRIHYRADVAGHMPYHGSTGTVLLAARARPRNHAVQLDGELVVIVVPAGNLRRREAPLPGAETKEVGR